MLEVWKRLNTAARQDFQVILEGRLAAYAHDERPHRRERLGTFSQLLHWWVGDMVGSCEQIVAEDGKLDWCDLNYARPRAKEAPPAITSRQAYTALGISQGTFSKWCRDLGIKAVGTYVNPKDPRGTPGMLWSLDDVEKLRAARAANPAAVRADQRLTVDGVKVVPSAKVLVRRATRITTARAAKKAGCSRSAFRHKAESMGLEPAAKLPGPHGWRWSPETVEAVAEALRGKAGVAGAVEQVGQALGEFVSTLRENLAPTQAAAEVAPAPVPSSSAPSADAPPKTEVVTQALEHLADTLESPTKSSLTHVVRMSEGRPVEIVVDEWREVTRLDFKPAGTSPRGLVVVREHRKDARLLLSGASGQRWEKFAGYLIAANEIDHVLGTRLDQVERELGLKGVATRVLPVLPARRI